MSKYRIVQSVRGKWVVCDWMALSEHDTEDEAKAAVRKYEAALAQRAAKN